MPTAAGILSIVAGAINLVGSVFFLIFSTTFGAALIRELFPTGWGTLGIPLVFGVTALFFVILDILAITGGINAIQRKNWGVAFAGSIAALFPSQLFGILAIVFISLSKKEFE
jgi:hypothetical protein